MTDAQGGSPQTTVRAAFTTQSAAEQQPETGNSTGAIERKPVALPPIFDRMPGYRRSEQVRAVMIETATPTENDKIKLTFKGGYFPDLEVESYLSAPIGDEDHYFMVDESGDQHIVPARGFDRYFKLNT